MQKTRNIFIWLIIGICIGCTPTTGPFPSTHETKESPSIYSSAIPTQSQLVYTQTVHPDILLSTPTQHKEISINAEHILTPRIKTNCLEIVDEIPAGLEIDGNLLLSAFENNGLKSYLLDLSTFQRTNLNTDEELIVDFIISPDRQRMAYWHTGKDDKENLVITDANGQKQMIFPWHDNWGYMLAWLDSEWLVITPSENGIIPSNRTDFILFNIYTQKEKLIHADFPGLYAFHPIPRWMGWDRTAYNPTLTHVVYLRGGEDGFGSQLEYVLWDLRNKETVRSLEVAGDLEAIPRWAPSGDQFVVAPSLIDSSLSQRWPEYELFSIDLTGKITQLTNLSASYPYYYISDFSWAPDGKHIAFWFATWEEKPELFSETNLTLAVLDLTNQLITSYCLQGEQNHYLGQSRRNPPLWSPDGDQLIINRLISNTQNRLVLVDLKNKIAVHIAYDVELDGWLFSQ